MKSIGWDFRLETQGRINVDVLTLKFAEQAGRLDTQIGVDISLESENFRAG